MYRIKYTNLTILFKKFASYSDYVERHHPPDIYLIKFLYPVR